MNKCTEDFITTFKPGVKIRTVEGYEGVVWRITSNLDIEVGLDDWYKTNSTWYYGMDEICLLKS
jgi:hypothetical protein